VKSLRPPTIALVVAIAALQTWADPSSVHFVEVAKESGLDFVHQSGRQGELWTLEITGAGVGVFDFDGDGWMDVWLPQGGPIADRTGELPGDRLYRNISKNGQLKFEDVTSSAGIVANEYSMGVATGDVDNDGDVDVFVTNYGANRLFLNLGGGRFRDATAESGFATATNNAWSIPASFADYDNDGWLDLYVGNYLEFDLAKYKPCTRWSTRPTYCAPSNFTAAQDRLFRNLGDGTFQDVTATTGIGKPRGGTMGVVADDFDGDGLTDFYVANDGVDNVMWFNQGDGSFRDGALLAGTAVNSDGIAEASMGIAIADFDHDDDADLFVTHDVKESSTLYRNESAALFADESRIAGVAMASLPYSAFGTGWLDAENDGDLDLFIANGAVAVIEDQAVAGIEPPLKQPNLLMINDGTGVFTAVLLDDQIEASRGAGFADLDNDGDIDVIVTNNHGPVHLFRNDSDPANWLGLALQGPKKAPHATGALVWVDGHGERKRVRTDGSYASAHDPRLLYGLGDNNRAQTVRVRWPDRHEERFENLTVNRYHTIRYGQGNASQR
jgi:hypothetical protein